MNDLASWMRWHQVTVMNASHTELFSINPVANRKMFQLIENKVS